MNPNSIKTRDLLARTKIRSYKTLFRWHRQGLIPAPVIETHPNGRGKIGYWPDWVVSRCLRIKRLLGNGHSLDQIAEILGSDWTAEQDRWDKETALRCERKVVLREDAIKSLVGLVWGKTMPQLRQSADDLQRVHRLLDAFLDEFQTERVVEMLREGFNPMLVLAGKSARIVPDFILAETLAEIGADGTPALVIPIWAEARKVFRELMPGLPAAPTNAPVSFVRSEVTGKVHRVRRLGPAGFTVLQPDGAKKKGRNRR